MKSKSEEESNQQPLVGGTTYKTKEDFLRWYREQDARKKKAQEEDNPRPRKSRRKRKK